MNVKEAEQLLCQVSRSELALKDLYEASKVPNRQVSYINSLTPDLQLEFRENCPELFVTNPTLRILNDNYIGMRREKNIAVQKHNRYTPIFEHRHIFFELIYVLSGKCIQYINGMEVHLKQGDVCIISPKAVHSIFVEDSIVLNILIKQDTFEEALPDIMRNQSPISIFFLDNLYSKRSIDYLIFHTGDDVTIKEEALKMYIEDLEDEMYSDFVLNSLCSIFLTDICRRHIDRVEFCGEVNSQNIDRYMIISYIQGHFTDLTLKELAEHFHYSEDYCSKLIKNSLGINFADLLRNIRIQHAKAKLLHTENTIENISASIGFKNPETFIRNFKRVTGLKPTEFRKKAENIGNPIY
jgi:AraC-like DNA-binding protein